MEYRLLFLHTGFCKPSCYRRKCILWGEFARIAKVWKDTNNRSRQESFYNLFSNLILSAQTWCTNTDKIPIYIHIPSLWLVSGSLPPHQTNVRKWSPICWSKFHWGSRNFFHRIQGIWLVCRETRITPIKSQFRNILCLLHRFAKVASPSLRGYVARVAPLRLDRYSPRLWSRYFQA